MELKVEEIKALAPIKFNYEDIKKWVSDKSNEYKKMVYTPETMSLAKQDRATLNKVSEAINNEKKRIKNELLKPFVDFESKCKELMAIVDDASKTIDKQIKDFEEKENNQKRVEIENYFYANIGDYKDLIEFEKIFNPRWLNKTYTKKKIEDEINHLFVKTNDDMQVIDNQIKDESINKAVKNYYFTNISDPSVLGNALQEGMRIDENNKKLEELKKAQEDKNTIHIETNENHELTKESYEQLEKVFSSDNKEKILQIDFRVLATKEQFMKLKEFLETNKIDYRRI